MGTAWPVPNILIGRNAPYTRPAGGDLISIVEPKIPAAMKHLLLTFACLIGIVPLLCSQSTVEHTVYFNTGDHSLDASARAVLDGILSLRDSCEVKGVIVRGHTDAIGEDTDNLKLSQARTLEVARYLRDQGFPTKRVKIKAHSENVPVASNHTARGRQQNRRVELKVYLGDSFNDEFDEEGVLSGDFTRGGDPGMTEEEEEDLSGVLKSVRSNIALYDCDRPLEMTGRKGASLSLPENAFENCGDKPIEIVVQEFHRIEDVAGYEVSTMAGDIQLESAGMICISALMDKVQLDAIREGAVVEVRIPAKKFDPEMGLYWAQNMRNRSEMDWSRIAGEAPYFEDSANSYVFNVSNLGCINLDKPAPSDANRMPLAVKVRKRLSRNPHLYCNYRDRGTMSEGVAKESKYITFGGAEIGENVRLKGRLSDKRTTFKIDKRIQVDTVKAKVIEIQGQEYRLIANVTGRRINWKDRFRRAKHSFGTEMSFREEE